MNAVRGAQIPKTFTNLGITWRILGLIPQYVTERNKGHLKPPNFFFFFNLIFWNVMSFFDYSNFVCYKDMAEDIGILGPISSML